MTEMKQKPLKGHENVARGNEAVCSVYCMLATACCMRAYPVAKTGSLRIGNGGSPGRKLNDQVGSTEIRDNPL